MLEELTTPVLATIETQYNLVGELCQSFLVNPETVRNQMTNQLDVSLLASAAVVLQDRAEYTVACINQKHLFTL
ncbi:hypothetical protein [Stenotrophomonas phage IME-SM1]|uniref:Uncharacterized protein n=1 Tax=Stenotrophomonas phage IME-SM1 TaxID=1654717 RepID=A0A0H4INV9_9CAUD|nr:hypothetical protein KMC40_gp051 [Stenotrophomonas phage IME-SM1]AKO61707.1 hypothetical protein [Stenotrophomonas phage IME-SM1]